MTAPIRPAVSPLVPTGVQPGRADARLAAQKAFFQTARADQPSATFTAASSVQRGGGAAASAAPADEPANQPPRPGSIIDIRV